jgi:hypothetical protein
MNFQQKGTGFSIIKTSSLIMFKKIIAGVRRFGETSPQSSVSKSKPNNYLYRHTQTLEDGDDNVPETSVDLYRTTWRYNRHSSYSDNLKPREIIAVHSENAVMNAEGLTQDIHVGKTALCEAESPSTCWGCGSPISCSGL